jgi:hypothetical protein
MSPREAYEICMSIKLHFKSAGYDAIKYGFKVSGRGRHIQNQSPGEQLIYVRLAKKFPNREELIDYCVAYSTAFGGNYWIGSLLKPDAAIVYQEWMKRRDSFYYQFKNSMQYLGMKYKLDELLKVDAAAGMPKITILWAKGSPDLCIEHVVMIDTLTNFSDHANKIINDKIFWPEHYLMLKKIRSFLSHIDRKKCKDIILQNFS